VLTLLVLTSLLAAPPRPALQPTPAALRRAVEAAAPALVEVKGPKAHGSGIVVGVNGEVLTSVHFVALEKARVRTAKGRAQAKVIAASAYLGTALVRPETSLSTRPVAVKGGATPVMGGWLIAVERATPRRATSVRILTASSASAFLQLATPLEPGTALFDDHGALVALVTRRQGNLSTAVKLSAVKAQLAAAGTR
jgi:hypothetical protein